MCSYLVQILQCLHLPIVLCCDRHMFTLTMTICCEFHKIVSLYQVSVFPFLSYMSLVTIVLVVGTKHCLQTNYGDVVKFITVPSFMCVDFLLV